ncbi:MAG TPA: DUF6049 family protein [Mycobacteriales bacterium]|nr:DUF6049 family protein [Mycobacteriales bacterium]
MTGRAGRLGRVTVAAVLVGSTLLAGGPAMAAPGVAGDVAAAHPVQVDPVQVDPGQGRPVQADPVESDPAAVRGEPEQPLPVKVTIERLEPREVKPGATIQVQAVLRNTGSTPTGPLKFRLQRGVLISTRSELAGTDKVAPAVTTRFAPSTPLPAGLAPGQALRVRYTCSADDLVLLGVGVYPLGFVVTETTQGSTVGRAQTLLPSFAGVDPIQTRVAWLWPLLDRPHRLLGQVGGLPLFDTDELARSVAKRGRLDQLLSAAEAVTGRVSLTLVVDPETIQELQLMTKGYRYGSLGRSSFGRGQQAAASWLKRLSTIARRHLLVIVPYGDPDIVALERGNLADLAWNKVTQQSDLALVTSALGVPATAQLAWPPGNLLTGAALDDVVGAGADAVVLDAAALPGGVSGSTPTPSAVSPLPSLQKQAAALVTDAELQTVVAHSTEFPGGPRLAEQRYLAELAMIGAEAPATQRTLVVTPPRRWTPSPGYASAVLADTGRISWLTSLTAGEVTVSTPPVDRGPLVYPPIATRAELPPDMIGTIGKVQTDVQDFRGVLGPEAGKEVLLPYGDALRRAGSAAWRLNTGLGQEYANGLSSGINALRRQIRIQKPATGIYTLASADSPLTLTVVNPLSTPVLIRVRITAPVGFHTGDIGVQQIPADSRLTLRLPAQVVRTGTFPIQAQVTSPNGRGLGGDPIRLTVRSTAYGSLALGITGAALLILICAMIFRMVRRLRSGPGEPEPAGSPADRSLS